MRQARRLFNAGLAQHLLMLKQIRHCPTQQLQPSFLRAYEELFTDSAERLEPHGAALM